MSKFTVELRSGFVTQWNEEHGDWSGDTFIKDGYTLDMVESNDFETVQQAVRNHFEIAEGDLDLDEGELFFSVVEDDYGMQDDNGHYLVDYHVVLEQVQTIAITE